MKSKYSFLLNYVLGLYLCVLHIWAYVFTPTEPTSTGYENIALMLSKDLFSSYITFAMILFGLVVISIEEYRVKYSVYFAGIILGISLMVIPNYPAGYFIALIFFSGVLKDVSGKKT